jgi:hypothetical protein
MVKSKRMRLTMHVECMEEMRNACKILVGNPEGKTSLGRPRCRWGITTDLREIGWGIWDWFHLARDMDLWWALVNTLIEPSGSINSGEFLD